MVRKISLANIGKKLFNMKWPNFCIKCHKMLVFELDLSPSHPAVFTYLVVKISHVWCGELVCRYQQLETETSWASQVTMPGSDSSSSWDWGEMRRLVWTCLLLRLTHISCFNIRNKLSEYFSKLKWRNFQWWENGPGGRRVCLREKVIENNR